MSEQRLAVQIRDAFDSTHVASPGLENRVMAAIPWDRPRDRSTSMPWLAGGLAAALAVAALAILILPTLLTRLNVQFPGSGLEPPAYSLAAVSANSVFVVQRTGIGAPPNEQPGNALLQSRDGGRSWVDRLNFAGVYGGMQLFGSDGFVWSIDMSSPNCTPGGGSCAPPRYALTLYRTADGGATWTARPAASFPVQDVFFLDASLGWAVSSTPQMGLGVEALYQTADGGGTWSAIGALPQASPMGYVFGVGNYRVTFSRAGDGSLTGWFVGATQLYSSRDGGHSWQALALGVPGPVTGSAATPSQPAFSGPEGVLPIAYHDPKGPDNATANRVYIYVSHDGGSTWGDPRPAPAGFAPVGDILSVAILDSRHIWLDSLSLTAGDNVQAAPAVARTADGGLTWTVATTTLRILQMAFGDPTHGFALDVTGMYNTNGIVKTSDGGATWERVTVPVFQPAP